MPTRGTKRAVVSGLSAEISMTVATDSDRHQAMLDEFATRQEAAVEAERFTRAQWRRGRRRRNILSFCELGAVQFLPNCN